MLNPSLGMTYTITEDTVVRATVARGFARPAGAAVTGWTGRVPFPGNPDLEPNIAWSYQAGIESGEFEKLYLKADLFYHRLDKSFIINPDTLIFTNGGVTKKKGFELNATAGPFNNLTTSLGLTYVRLDELEDKSDDFYIFNAKLRYKDLRIGTITLFGQYLWFGTLQSTQRREPRYDDMLWDLHYKKDIYTTEKTKTNFFISVRNLFNGANYSNNIFLNPERWVEVGLRISF